MTSWESKSWPLRRWLADRLIGRRGYSKNVATAPQDWIAPIDPGFYITTERVPPPPGFEKFGSTWITRSSSGPARFKPFDQETA